MTATYKVLLTSIMFYVGTLSRKYDHRTFLQLKICTRGCACDDPSVYLHNTRYGSRQVDTILPLFQRKVVPVITSVMAILTACRHSSLHTRVTSITRRNLKMLTDQLSSWRYFCSIILNNYKKFLLEKNFKRFINASRQRKVKRKKHITELMEEVILLCIYTLHADVKVFSINLEGKCLILSFQIYIKNT